MPSGVIHSQYVKGHYENGPCRLLPLLVIYHLVHVHHAYENIKVQPVAPSNNHDNYMNTTVFRKKRFVQRGKYIFPNNRAANIFATVILIWQLGFNSNRFEIFLVEWLIFDFCTTPTIIQWCEK